MYRILVVDDEAKIRLLIRKYAEFEGHEVTEAENGMEAVRLFRKTPDAFDIVIMDVMMPELDGFRPWRRLRRLHRRPSSCFPHAARSMIKSTALNSAWTIMS